MQHPGNFRSYEQSLSKTMSLALGQINVVPEANLATLAEFSRTKRVALTVLRPQYTELGRKRLKDVSNHWFCGSLSDLMSPSLDTESQTAICGSCTTYHGLL